jgi:type II secretory pathway component PulJ
MKHSRGFTLIEVILILIIMAVLTTLFVSYLGTAYTQSPASAGLVNKQYRLMEQMEILTSQYRQALDEGNGAIANLCAFQAAHVNGLQIDGQSIVDTANTSCTYTITDNTGTYTTRNALLVTLTYTHQKPTYEKQTLQCIFTN